MNIYLLLQGGERYVVPDDMLMADTKLLQGALALEKQQAAYVQHLQRSAHYVMQ